MTTMFKGMDTSEIRSSLVAKLQQNKEDLEQLQPIIREVDTNYPEVWEEGTVRPKPKEEWDDSYFIMLTTQLLMTCSRDMFMHAIEVGKVVAFRQKEEKKHSTSSSQQNSSYKKSTTNANYSSNNKGSDIPKIVGIVIGGIALVVVAYLLIK